MSKTMTIELTDNLYELWVETSNRGGQSPEQMIIEWLEERIRLMANDPLLQLAGVIEAEITDVAERHDYYRGEAASNHNG